MGLCIDEFDCSLPFLALFEGGAYMVGGSVYLMKNTLSIDLSRGETVLG